VPRPARVVLAEVLLTAGTAYLVGVCAAIVAGSDQAPAAQLVLGAVGLGLVLAYALWLLGGSGVPLAALNLPLLILAADALLIESGYVSIGPGTGLLPSGLTGAVPALLAVAAAGAGLVLGLVLPGPRRLRLTHGVHGQQVNSAALLSEGAVMERLRSTPPVARAAGSTRDAVWFDDSRQEVHAVPATRDPRANPVPPPDVDRGPDVDPGPDPMPAPDPMPDPDPMPLPDADGYAERRDAEERGTRDSFRSEQHLQ
jgi:hypothetical protein